MREFWAVLLVCWLAFLALLPLWAIWAYVPAPVVILPETTNPTALSPGNCLAPPPPMICPSAATTSCTIKTMKPAGAYRVTNASLIGTAGIAHEIKNPLNCVMTLRPCRLSSSMSSIGGARVSVLILVVDDEEDVPGVLAKIRARWRRHANLVSAPFPTALITLLLAVGLATSALSAQLVVSLEGWPREDANGRASAKLAKTGLFSRLLSA